MSDFTSKGKFAKGNQVHRQRENPGRRVKLCRFLEEMKRVLEFEHPAGRAVILTDFDLLRLTNERLEEKDRVSVSRFTGWKTYEFEREEDRNLAEEFREMYSLALAKQKDSLFEAMLSEGEERSWHRYAWLLERKFDEWNLRSKTIDETPDLKRLVFVREVPVNSDCESE